MSINIGTSSIKCALFDVIGSEKQQLLSKTRVYPLHKDELPKLSTLYPLAEEQIESTKDTKTALRDAVSLALTKAQKTKTDLFGIGIRIVHSGGYYTTPVGIDDVVLSSLQETRQLAPLHNPAALDGIGMLNELYPGLRLVAVFDTNFHETMPDRAKFYAIREEYASRFGVRRYGFHGLAHSSMLEMYSEAIHTTPDASTLITIQLGSGCSMCAIKNGKSIDTTMGFSPLEGLVSRTRSGDIDPSIVTFLSEKMHLGAADVVQNLNQQSGLLGMAGLSGDVKDILDYAKLGDPLAAKAVDRYVYRIQKYIGAYHAVLGKTDAIIMGGGVIEHCPDLWARILDLPSLGIVMKAANQITLMPPLTELTTTDSKIPVWAAFVDEEKEIARLTHLYLTSH